MNKHLQCTLSSLTLVLLIVFTLSGRRVLSVSPGVTEATAATAASVVQTSSNLISDLYMYRLLASVQPAIDASMSTYTAGVSTLYPDECYDDEGTVVPCQSPPADPPSDQASSQGRRSSSG